MRARFDPPESLPMEKPAASVIVPMRNVADVVLEQVAALQAQATDGFDFEVIWVDNGSTDGTLQLVSDAVRGDHRMRVISAPELRSSYFARNRGVEAARADLLLFCDADDVADPRWIAEMVAALEHLDVVGGALRHGAEAEPSLTDGQRHGFLLAAPTANLGVRRATFEAVGGFDGRIASGEDWALCWRAQLDGHRFGYRPSAVVLYRPRPTKAAEFRRRWTRGRWYRVWSVPFVPLGADAPTVRASLARIATRALLPALKKPHGYHVRIVLWNAAIISAVVWPPRTRTGGHTRSGDPRGSPLRLQPWKRQHPG